MMHVVGRVGCMDSRQGLYFASKFLGQVSQNLFFAALFVAAGTGGNAALGLSTLFVAQLVPAMVLGVVGGAIADRAGPARGVVLGQALRAATLFAAVFAVHGPTTAVLIAAVYSAGSQVLSPAELALVRTIQRDAPGRAHSFIVGFQYGGQGVGMLLLAPALYFLGGPTLMFAGAFLGFAGLTALSGMLAWRLRDTPACDTLPMRSAFTFGATCRFFLDEPRARYAVVASAMKTVVARGIIVALPIYLHRDMGLGGEALVYLVVPGVAGVVVGLLWAGRSLTLDRAMETMRLTVVGMVVAVFALAVLDYGLEVVADFSMIGPMSYLEASMNTTFVVALPAAFLLGLSLTGSLVAARVALTATAPAGHQSRVFAVQETLTESLLVLPLLLTGVGTAVVGARATLAAIGLVGAFAVAILELPRFRHIPHRRPDLLPELATAEAAG